MMEKLEKGYHINIKATWKLCAHNNDDIVILDDLELDDNRG